MTINYQITPLCQLGYQYGTDKSPQIKHSYTPFYYYFLKNDKEKFKKVLEVGIGKTRKNLHVPEKVYELGIAPYLRRGASLYMWRDFFPNAHIYGADNDELTIFQDKRISTYMCDEKNKQDLINLVNDIGSDIDLVIDDASHRVDDQINLARNLLPLLKKSVNYIIEDVSHTKKIKNALNKQGGYEYLIPDIPRKWRGGMLLVIRNKSNVSK